MSEPTTETEAFKGMSIYDGPLVVRLIGHYTVVSVGDEEIMKMHPAMGARLASELLAAYQDWKATKP